MKKIISSLTICAICAMGLVSCEKGGKNNTPAIDSVTYAIGIAQSQGLKQYLSTQMELDTMNLNAFFSGLKEGIKELKGSAKAKAIGIQIGQQLRDNVITGVNRELFGPNDSVSSINPQVFLDAFIAATKGEGAKMTLTEAQDFLQANMERIKAEALANNAENKKNKEEGEAFLLENKKKAGVKTTESGLQYRVVTEGKGEKPALTDRVKVNYKGTLIDGSVFDESAVDTAGVKTPSPMMLSNVVKAWQEALPMMNEGSKWILYVPQDLAYGARQAGEKIAPFSTLIFEIELVEVEKVEVPQLPAGVEIF